VHIKERQREKRNFLCQFEPSIFPPLTEEERAQDWGKEYEMGFLLAQDFDLYRAITSFKRSLLLLGQNEPERRLELQYYMLLCYYLGQKYVEVIYIAESGDLQHIEPEFVIYDDLLVILYDSYRQTDQCEKAAAILSLMEAKDMGKAEKLVFFSAVETADFEYLSQFEKSRDLVCCYQSQKKSVRKARTLNALLPGAGYWYLGQRRTATTALLVNALFIGSSAYFFANDNIAAGVLFLTFEGGWYFGGINGAGLCAKYYNERLWEGYGAKICNREKLFPLLMVKFSF